MIEHAKQTLQLDDGGIGRFIIASKVEKKKISSDVVASVVKKQGIPLSRYYQVDKTKLSNAERKLFDIEVEAMEAELGRERIGKLSRYKHGCSSFMKGGREGICLPTTPAIAYRNRETGELLTPSVPAIYFEHIERANWAFNM